MTLCVIVIDYVKMGLAPIVAARHAQSLKRPFEPGRYFFIIVILYAPVWKGLYLYIVIDFDKMGLARPCDLFYLLE